jgi:hypothetical protein
VTRDVAREAAGGLLERLSDGRCEVPLTHQARGDPFSIYRAAKSRNAAQAAVSTARVS